MCPHDSLKVGTGSPNGEEGHEDLVKDLKRDSQGEKLITN